MTRVVAAGLCLVVGVQVVALMLLDRRLLLPMAGAAAAVVLLAIRWALQQQTDAAAVVSNPDDRRESLQRWLARTETLIGWSEATRSDWDRHLRPMLARQFEMATSQRKVKDPKAFDDAGRMLFGADLWAWVDPDNVARSGNSQRGPGRAALHDILQRLEQI